MLVRVYYLPGSSPARHVATPAPSAAAAPSAFAGPPGSSVLAAPPVPGDGRFYLGVSSSQKDLAAYDAAAGVSQPAVFGGYTQGSDGSVAAVLSFARDLPGTIPMVSWGVNFRGGAVTDGSADAYLRAQAAAVIAYGRPVFIRLDWEMNGNWYPEWSSSTVSPSAYVASWQHVWTIFHDAGVTNAAFVWCPNVGDFGGVPWTDWYPGSAYVDWVGMDAYPKPSNLTAYVSGAGGLDAFAQYAEQIGKPAMLAEWAPGDSADPAADFDAVFSWATRYPDAVKALLYFNFSGGGQDYLLTDDPTGAGLVRQFVEQNRADLSGVGGTG